jgi:chaperonin cofactor prefoldin
VIVERIAKLPKVQRKINELRSVGDTEKIERIAAMKKKVSQELKENRRKLDELAKSRKRWF